ncbi:MAG: site-specific DNA-methyltransferase [Thermodesulfovibrio sp.]|nr:site-specific DNA-methyltransferase [Thermodesulfovibrio sp.]MDW7973421.1 site-specific DNA-methyltransferase [Thermodesulfovibrio sp.]
MSESRIKITPAKGRPMLNWVGKKPLEYVKGFPAQLIEVFNPLNNSKKIETPTYEELKDNWQNLLFYGDNKEVLATLLELGFRGKIDLIYIDPPFKSGADYVRKVELRGIKELGSLENDEASVLQQTMYFDIWNNDNYLQFMYERLQLMKELLSETGSIYVHLDWHVGHYVKIIMDEIFGQENFRNEIVWCYTGPSNQQKDFPDKHDVIYRYSKSDNYCFNSEDIRIPYVKLDTGKTHGIFKERAFLNEKGKIPEDWWSDITPVARLHATELLDFITQKPEALLERIIKASSNEGDIVLDCFCGSGTTLAVAQKLGRRWIGCDINKGAIQLTSSRLQKIIKDQIKKNETKYPTFALYKVNNYDLKLLHTEAIELAVQHIGIQRTRTDTFFDGTLGKNLVKIIDFNHPLTLLDLQLLQDELKKRPDEDRDITIVCLGKELAVDAWIDEWNKKHPVNKIRVIELRTDKKYGNFLIHKPAEAKVEIKRKNNKVFIEIKDFISPTIIERLNIDNQLWKVKIADFRAMINYILIDKDYDGKVFNVFYSDVPQKKTDLIKGKYELEVNKDKTKIAVKIVDMLGEEVLITKDV